MPKSHVLRLSGRDLKDFYYVLGVDPETMMCASSRMIVKKKNAHSSVVVPCTLLPYEKEFELGTSLAGSIKEVRLNHPHCAKFCVLGGGSCSPS